MTVARTDLDSLVTALYALIGDHVIPSGREVAAEHWAASPPGSRATPCRPACTARTVLRLRAAELDPAIATPPGVSGRASACRWLTR